MVEEVEVEVEVVEVEVEVVVAVAVAYLRRSARLCCRKSRAWASQSLRRRLHSSAHRGMWKRPSLCCSGERNERADGASWCWAGAHVSRGLYPVGLTTRDVTTASGETESRVSRLVRYRRLLFKNAHTASIALRLGRALLFARN